MLSTLAEDLIFWTLNLRLRPKERYAPPNNGCLSLINKYEFTSPTMKGQLSKKKLDALMHRAYLKVHLSGRFFRSMFNQRTSLRRLRRTMFGVFWSWIWFLVTEQVRCRFATRRKSSQPHRRGVADRK